MHLFAIPSLVASFFQHNDAMEKEDLLKSCKILFPFLRVEMFLPWKEMEFDEYLCGLIAYFIKLGLLREEGSSLYRAEVTSPVFGQLMLLGRTLGQTFDRFAVVAAILKNYESHEELDRSELEEKSQLMAQRISILEGKNDPEFSDKRLFSNYLDTLRKQNYLCPASPGKVVVDQKITELYECSIHLLGLDMRSAIQRMSSEKGILNEL